MRKTDEISVNKETQLLTKSIEKISEIWFNPMEDRLIGVNMVDESEILYFKNDEFGEYVLMMHRETYLDCLNKYIDSKKDFCERYKHFCGVNGDFSAEEGFKLKELFYINEYKGEGDESKGEDEFIFEEVGYPLYFVQSFNSHCDMEHG